MAKKATDIVTATTKGAAKGIAESVMENKSTIGLYYLAANAIPFIVWTSSKVLAPFLDQVGKNLALLIVTTKTVQEIAPAATKIAKVFFNAATQTY
ncbi:MAG: hypothetical protein ABIF12_00575 [bacterium]